MAEAYLLDAIRTPIGRRGGGLSAIHSADLGAHVIKAIVGRTKVDPTLVDDVIFGCTDTLGPQAGNIARTAWLAAGYPDHVPGVTVDRQCGSSQQAVHFAAQAVLSGTADLVLAGGVQNMSQIPISAAMLAGREFGFDDPLSGSKGWQDRYGSVEVSQFRSAEMIAEHWGISREAMEDYAYRSHQRALAAIDEGRFDAEIVPVDGLRHDEGPRRDTSLERMAGFATAHALRKTGLSIDDIDLFEVNEAFASVVLAWLDETGADPERVNVNGGGIALGHPIGATGTKLLASLRPDSGPGPDGDQVLIGGVGAGLR